MQQFWEFVDEKRTLMKNLYFTSEIWGEISYYSNGNPTFKSRLGLSPTHRVCPGIYQTLVGKTTCSVNNLLISHTQLNATYPYSNTTKIIIKTTIKNTKIQQGFLPRFSELLSFLFLISSIAISSCASAIY